jgi:predicted signal transduction protein with EAL and GGDEF domain
MALDIAHRILSALREPVRLGSRDVVVHASLGLRIMTGEMDVDALLRDADVALYTAKALGGDRVELFASKMRRTRLQTQRMEMDLRGAAGRGELRLEYQPVVDLSAMRTVGVEALLRWDRPQEGLLSAGRFI